MFQAGNYHAEVKYISMEILEGKTGQQYPVLKIVFQPNAIRNGSVFVEGTFPLTNKIYFLSEELVRNGPNAGRSRIELLRDTLKDTYDYEGGLDDGLASIVGRKVELVIRPKDGSQFMEVAFVNKIGAVGKQRTGKPIDVGLLSKLQAAFKGEKVTTGNSPDPKAFFLQLKGLNPSGN